MPTIAIVSIHAHQTSIQRERCSESDPERGTSMFTGSKVRLRALEREDLLLTNKWANTLEIMPFEARAFPLSMADE